MLLSLNSINQHYEMDSGHIDVLKSISFTVEKGEFISIMGPSGSGKSSLLNILGCLHKPASGSYILEDTNIAELSERKLSEVRSRKIGFIFQTFNLIPRLSALRNVELPLIYQGVDRSERKTRAYKSLEQVMLKGREHHKPSQLSGGQRQRVAIARALVTNPCVILADEPTGNLDSKSEKNIIEIFATLHKKGNTIIMVTHEDSIAQCSQRIITIKDGFLSSDDILFD